MWVGGGGPRESTLSGHRGRLAGNDRLICCVRVEVGLVVGGDEDGRAGGRGGVGSRGLFYPSDGCTVWRASIYAGGRLSGDAAGPGRWE